MRSRPSRMSMLAGATAVLAAGAYVGPEASRLPAGLPVAAAPTTIPADSTVATGRAVDDRVARARAALEALSSGVRGLSHPRALEDAFRSYFAYRAAHPEQVRKPYLYFVDYGQPSTAKRGYVFDMDELRVVDGPFTVAHGRGSSKSKSGVPTKFSNAPGSAATSLGLYLAQETYRFSGKAGGRRYTSIGLRMKGLSGDFNDNARARGVVAHGAPYVSSRSAGRSEGCPAVEEPRARRLLPMIAEGGMVFLFAPDARWMAADPWIAATADLM